MKSLVTLALIAACSSPALADDNKISTDHDRFSGFIIAAGGYRISPHFSDLVYFRTDSDNDVVWIYNTYDRDVLAPQSGGGWSVFNAINYNNSHVSTYAGYAYEKPLSMKADFMTKVGANYKLNALTSPYQGLQLRADYDCRRGLTTTCALRPEAKYDWKF
jgi:hypothetical protein